MADQRYSNDTVLVDATTKTQQLAISAGGAASVSLTASSATVTVDTELPTAAALADGAANPTTPLIGSANLVFNGTTWDRARGSAAAVDSTGTGIQAVGIVGQLDDTSTQTVTENQFAHVRISSRRALLVEGVASGTALAVTLTSTTITGTVTVDTELPAAAALSDAFANPTTSTVGAMGMIWNGATWDRVKEIVAALDSAGTGIAAVGIVGQLDDVSTSAVTENQYAAVRISARRALLVEGVASGTNLNVNLAASGATVTVDTELPAAAALTDAFANPTAPGVGAFLMGWNSATWDRLKSTTANGLVVDVSRVQGTVTVDTELTAVAALADATANPTITNIASFLMGYNGATWDRVRTANTGRLQVDVITGGSADTPTNPIVKTVTISALAAGSSSTTELRTVDLGGLTKKLTMVKCWGSVAFKADLQTVANGVGTSVAVGGAPAFNEYEHQPPGERGGRNYYSVAHPANAGFDGWQIILTNLDASEAADFYAVIYYED
jgi:hypothetical protein